MDCDESNCPPKKKAKLDESEEKSGLPMPVKLEKELESLLDLTKQSCLKQSKDRVQSDLNLFRRLNSSFRKLLNHNALNNWGPDVHRRVKEKCERLVELCVCVMDEDSVAVLQTLALVFNPTIKFHTFNASKMPESLPSGSNILDKKVYARPLADPKEPRGWLVDLINRFGNLGGFLVLLSRFQRGRRSLTLQLINALFWFLHQCHMLLTVDTIAKYFVPIIERLPAILDSIINENFETLTNNVGSVQRYIVGTIDAIKSLLSRMPEHGGIIKNLKSFEMRTMFRFFLNMGDHAAHSICKHVENFNVQQWNDLLEYFQTSWKTANDNTRRKMLEVIQRWVKGYSTEIVSLVLALLQDLARSDKSTQVMDKILKTHATVLKCFDSSKISKEDDYHILDWLGKCVEEVKSNDKWALLALIHIKDICNAFNYGENVNDLNIRIKDLLDRHDILTLVINNLTDYMDKMRQVVEENPDSTERSFIPGGCYNHRMQMQRRLQVLSCLVRNRNLSPGTEQLKQIWHCLVEEPIFPSDQDNFGWFVNILKSNNNCVPEVVKDFLEQSVLRLDPTLLTDNRFQWFKYFFVEANKSFRGKSVLDELIGIDYLWHVVTSCPESIALDGFKLLKEMNKNVGSQLSVSDNHKTLIAEFRNQLQVHSDALTRLTGVDETLEGNDQRKNEIVKETQKMIQLMVFMEEYIKECGWKGNEEPRK